MRLSSPPRRCGQLWMVSNASAFRETAKTFFTTKTRRHGDLISRSELPPAPLIQSSTSMRTAFTYCHSEERGFARGEESERQQCDSDSSPQNQRLRMTSLKRYASKAE